MQQVLSQTRAVIQTPTLASMSTVVIPKPHCMHGAPVAQFRMLHVRQAWRSIPGGPKVLRAGTSHFLPQAEKGGEHGGCRGWWWWGWGGGCSQQKGIPRMLSFNLESASHTLSPSLTLTPWLFAWPVFIWPPPAFLLPLRGEEVAGKRKDGLEMQSSWPKKKKKLLHSWRLTHCLSTSVQHLLWVCISAFMQAGQRRKTGG